MGKEMTRVIIDGNICTGKSQILDQLKKKYGDQLVLCSEPMSVYTQFWGPLTNEIWNPLKIYYKDVKKNSFMFQVLVLAALHKELMWAYKEASDKGINCIVQERDAASSVHVFSRMNINNSFQLDVLTYLMETLSETLNLGHRTMVIYLQSKDPKVLESRLKNRARFEEMNKVDRSYLSHLNRVYDNWAIYDNCEGVKGSPLSIHTLNADRDKEEVFSDVEKLLLCAKVIA